MSKSINKKKRSFRLLIFFCALGAFIISVLHQLSSAESQTSIKAGATTDFVDFWAASRLLLKGENPFSPAAVLALQQSVGMNEDKPLLMWNPPWTLSITLPFGILNYPASEFAWMVLNILAILISAQTLWRIYTPSQAKSFLPWMIALTFTPVWFVLIIGQISSLVLLGVVGFVYFERKQKYFVAGAFLVLVSIKPHLLYLLWVALVVWLWKERIRMCALGAAVGGAIAAAIPALIDPLIFTQFIHMYRFPGRSTPLELPAPGLGRLLANYIPHGTLPIQFFPPLVGILWFLFRWRNDNENWNWSEQIPLLALVSITFGFYSWTYDYVVLLPAVFHGCARVQRQNFSWRSRSTVLLYACINLSYFLAKLFVTTDLYFSWVAPALLLTYLSLEITNKTPNYT